MIAIVDYGLGNVKAFANVYHGLNIPAAIAKNADDLKGAARIILPGVGAFDHAMKLLEKSGMKPLLDELVLGRRVPVLGICVGMQMLAGYSEEGSLPGLGWIEGEVRRFRTAGNLNLQVPHMGWNSISPVMNDGLLRGLDGGALFYFLHSYYFQCRHNQDILAVTEYGERFASAVCSGNIYGVQFHPEKSHQGGIQLLKNFAEL